MREIRKHPILAAVVAAWVVFSICSMATSDGGDCYYFSQRSTDC